MIKAFNLNLYNVTATGPLIFLDIDGVICKDFDPNRIEHATIASAIRNINEVINITGARLDLSSFRTYFQSNINDVKQMGIIGKFVDYIQYLNATNVVEEKNIRILNETKIVDVTIIQTNHTAFNISYSCRDRYCSEY